MLGRAEAGGKKMKQDSTGKFLNEIETISRGLYLDKPLLRASIAGTGAALRSAGRTPPSKSKVKQSAADDLSHKDKKSLWNWKPLKALTSSRNKKFKCCFSLTVHSIVDLPSRFENASLCVHWKKRDGELVTRPSKVLDRVAEFEEKLTHECVVHGSRNGPHHSAKYDAKHFLIFASLLDAKDLDLGKHRVDLTRFLPLTLEELEDEKSSGTWTTSFRLSGEAKGASINVSFGYTVTTDSPVPTGNRRVGDDSLTVKHNGFKTRDSIQLKSKRMVTYNESLPVFLVDNSHELSKSAEDARALDQLLLPNPPALVSEIDKGNDGVNEKIVEMVDFRPEDEENPEIPDATEESNSVISSLSSKPVNDVNVVDNMLLPSCSATVSDGDVMFSTSHEERIKTLFDLEPDNDVTILSCDATDVRTCDTPEHTVDSFNNLYGNGATSKIIHDRMSEKCLIDVPEAIAEGAYDGCISHDSTAKTDVVCSKESVLKELEDALANVSNLDTEISLSPEETEMHAEKHSAIFEDDIETVANDFLDMLGIEYSPSIDVYERDPESPRECLLRQFEKDALDGGFDLFEFDDNDTDQADDTNIQNWCGLRDEFDLESILRDVEEEHYKEAQDLKGKMSPKTMEDMESEALMREWGLNDNSFQCSPPAGGFATPVGLTAEEPSDLPPLGEGLGSFMQTKNGGFLRSMSPNHFQNAKRGGSLIMQVSSPVVVPAEMGSDVMDIIHGFASIGIEKLSMQANKLMPLDDITGKTMQQVAWEAGALEGIESQTVYNESKKPSLTSKMPKLSNSEYVTLEELAPLAMEKIESLSMEGLKIQSGMSLNDATSNITAKFTGDYSALEGNGVDGVAGLQLLETKDSCDEVDGLMGLSLTLDEWMRLDSGDFGDEDTVSERTSKILAAHHADSLDSIRGRKRGKGGARKCGLLGDTFTVSLLVQLRDPLRNYEPVGTPMLAFVQVERVFAPPKPKIYYNVSGARKDDDSDTDIEELPTEKEKAIPQFQINEVHVAGIKVEPGIQKTWGTAKQQQSGSRWLLANGMGKSNKNALKPKTTNSAPSMQTKTPPPNDTLWSISSKGSKWNQAGKINHLTRNPNVLVPKELRKLR